MGACGRPAKERSPCLAAGARPPFGVGYYTACAIAKIETSAGLEPIVGYMLALVVGLIAVAFLPWLTTAFLPAP